MGSNVAGIAVDKEAFIGPYRGLQPCLWNITVRPGNLERIASSFSSQLLKLVPR